MVESFEALQRVKKSRPWVVKRERNKRQIQNGEPPPKVPAIPCEREGERSGPISLSSPWRQALPCYSPVSYGDSLGMTAGDFGPRNAFLTTAADLAAACAEPKFAVPPQEVSSRECSLLPISPSAEVMNCC